MQTMDIGGNAAGLAKNGYDIYDNGPSLSNIAGVAGNGLGIVGNLKTRYNTSNPALKSNKEVRRWYVDQARQISVDESLPLRERAIQASLRRNELRQQARDMMTDRALAAEFDISDPILPVSDYVRKAYKEKGLVGDELWESILKGSTKTRQSINVQLGIND